MYTLKDINIYPVKSMGKISLTQAFAESRGLKHDRRMMLTDEQGKFLSQREIPEMAKFRMSMEDDGFLVKYEDEKLFLPFQMKRKRDRKVRIWADELIAPEADGHYSQWFSKHLKRPCRLIFMDKATTRKVDHRYAVNQETVSFSDGFPYLLIGTASLEDLNMRMQVPVPMDRFRPNLVISTHTPFVEDSFNIVRIGKVVFKRVKPCARCIVTTTDQNTGIRDKEPLLTLSSYRKKDNRVLFGQNLVCLREGVLKVGDTLALDMDFNYADIHP